ncbi:variable large family protein [Borrelia duttonii]|uniref:Variable large protein n=1 Tax=Borrelia duttonii (strain Ly) TaxID=412419 RepID=B5RP75_BORDL|nr:vlp protein, beta subfamily [Borrelia duttonii Ly]
MNIEKKGEGKVRVILLMMMMVMMGCNSGGVKGGEVNLEAKNSFLESLIKIGEGFQEIFDVFGSAVGDALGFSVVKAGDKRSKVGEHFEKIGKGLQVIKDKLNGLAKDIASAPYVDSKGVESIINSASEVIVKLIASVTKLAGVTKEDTIIDNAGTAGNAAAVAAEEASVKAIIEEVKAIIEIAMNSGVKIEKGNAGNSVANGNGPKAVVHNAQASAGDATKLVDEVAKADPWAMIDKIKSAKTKNNVAPAANDDAGQLATATGANDNGSASTNADLAASVALKAMTKGGKFTQPAANEDGAIKAAAASAVNKVLGILDVIINKAVNLEFNKVKEAVKGIKYAETVGTEIVKSSTIQSIVTK